MGIREQIIFPEIDYDNIDQVRGLDVTITTSAQTDAEAFALLSALGMPYARDGRPAGYETLEQLKEENPEAYAKPEPEPAEGEEAAEGGETPAEPAGDQET